MRFLLILFVAIVAFPSFADDAPEIVQVGRLGRGEAYTLAWRPDGKVLAVGSATGVWFFDEDFQELGRLAGDKSVNKLEWSADGTMFAISYQSDDCNIDLYTYGNFELLKSFQVCESKDIKWSPSSKYLTIGDRKTGLHSFYIREDSISEIVYDSIIYYDWHPNADIITTSTRQEIIQIYDMDNDDPLTTFTPLLKPVAWSSDSRQIATIFEYGITATDIPCCEGGRITLRHPAYKAILVLNADGLSVSSLTPIENAWWSPITDIQWIDENTLITDCDRTNGEFFSQYLCSWDLKTHLLNYDTHISGGSSSSGNFYIDSNNKFIAIPIYWRYGFTKILNIDSGEMVTEIANTVFDWKPNSSELTFVDHEGILSVMDVSAVMENNQN